MKADKILMNPQAADSESNQQQSEAGKIQEQRTDSIMMLAWLVFSVCR